MKQTVMKIMERCLTGSWLPALVVAAIMTIAMRASAATEYVSQTSTNPAPPYATPDTAANNIQDAVDVANDGDTVLVMPGEYDLTDQVTIAKAITLQSRAGAGATFVNALNPTWCLWVSNSLAIVDGFTVENTNWIRNHAGGVESFGATIQNCTFTNFVFPGPGPGASVTMIGGILSNSVAFYNHVPPPSTGIAVYCTGGGLVTDCQILTVDNIGFTGVGIHLENSQLRNSLVSGLGRSEGGESGASSAVQAFNSTIIGCTISRNYSQSPGSGAYLNNCLMDQCVIAYNLCAGAPGAGGGIFETNSIVRDSLIVSNSATGGAPDEYGYGGGVYMQSGALVNCTVANNGASAQGGDVYIESGGITNSIIFDNSGNVWFNAGAGIFDHCCTTPDPGGQGNIVQDPQFIDPADGNYHLLPTSPCKAAGIVQDWMTGAQDLDGNPRTANGAVDMGAYESHFKTHAQSESAADLPSNADNSKF